MHGALAAVLILGAAVPSPSPKPAPPRSAAAPRVMTPTRTAVTFGGLERQLEEAIQHRDAARIDALLDADFELRGPLNPGEPVPREDWQAAVLAAPPRSFQVSEVAVHMAGDDAAIVSFAYDQQAPAPAPSGRFSFVDVWTRQKGQWRLAVRYAAPASDAPLPGLVAAEPEIDKKY